MPNVTVIGAQWGDEGKGKVVDWLASRADIVVRFQGGHNAGHTLVVGNETYKLSLLPSGLVRGKLGIIGNGVVVDPEALLAEIAKVRAQGLTVTPDTLRIAENVTLILPLHSAIDRAREVARGDRKIGTTGRGIGPAYEDKIARRAVRLADLFHRERFAAKLGEVLDYHNFILKNYFRAPPVAFQKTLEDYLALVPELEPMVADITPLLFELHQQGKNVLFEGAQGALLDVDHGTYPYVTSSNTTAGGAATGTGLGPLYFDQVLGIVKAYATRVGEGPMPTELFDAMGEHLARRGHEFGSVTGRPRRCGWFDVAAMRRSIINNSVSSLCVTKLDVLDGIDTIRICVAYKTPQGEMPVAPMGAESFAESEPVYVDVPGWKTSTVGLTKYKELPENARAYLKKMEELMDVPVDIISTGPDRAQTIVLKHPFD